MYKCELADAAGVSRQTFYNWTLTDQDILAVLGGIQKRKNATSMRSAIPLRKVPDIPRISTLSSIIVKQRQPP